MSANPGPQPMSDMDLCVAERIAARRLRLGLTQKDVPREIGTTHQQVWKYEVGVNRITAGRLYQIAKVLRCEPADFFPDVPPVAEADARTAALVRDTASLSREERHVVFDAARRLAAA